MAYCYHYAPEIGNTRILLFVEKNHINVFNFCGTKYFMLTLLPINLIYMYIDLFVVNYSTREHIIFYDPKLQIGYFRTIKLKNW